MTGGARRWLSRSKIRLTPESRSIVLSPAACGTTPGAGDVSIRIRRRGCDDDCWLLSYPQFDTDERGRLRFILDSQLTALGEGRYEAEVMQGCDPCGSFEIILPPACGLDLHTAAAVPGETVKVINGSIPDVTDIFNAVNTLNASLCAVLEPTDTRIPLSQSDKDALCALTLCRGVELLLTDGVKSEFVLFEGCEGGEVTVTRGVAGSSPGRFPVGTELCFTWTSANVAAAAEGCL